MPSKMTQVSRFSVILLLIDWQVVVDVVLLFLTQKWLVRLRNILAGLHFAASVGSWGVLAWRLSPVASEPRECFNCYDQIIS